MAVRKAVAGASRRRRRPGPPVTSRGRCHNRFQIPRRTKDPLALNGYPPKTANLLVTLSSSGGVGLSANVAVESATTVLTPSCAFRWWW